MPCIREKLYVHLGRASFVSDAVKHRWKIQTAHGFVTARVFSKERTEGIEGDR